MRRLRRILLVLLLLVAAAGAIAFHAMGRRMIEDSIARNIQESVAAQVSIGRLSLSLIPFQVTIEDARLRRDGREMLELPRLEVDLLLAASIWQGRWVGDVTIRSPVIRLRPGATAWTYVIENRKDTLQPRVVTIQSATVFADLGESQLAVRDLAVDATFSGLLRPRVRFSARSRGTLSRNGADDPLTLRRIAVTGESTGEEIRVEHFVALGPAGKVELRGRAEPGAVAAVLEGELRAELIAPFVPGAPEARGTIAFSGDVFGSADAPEWSLRLEAEEFQVDRISASIDATIAGTTRDWTLEEGWVRAFGGSARAEASGSISPLRPRWLRGTVSGVRLEELVPALGGAASARGAIGADAHLQFRDDGLPHGHMTAAIRTDGGVDARWELEGDPIAGGVTWTSGGSIGTRTHARSTIRVVRGSIEGEIEARSFDLTSVGALVGFPIEGRGTLRGEVAGTTADPRMNAALAFESLVVDGIEWGEVTGPIELDARSARFGGLHATGLSATLSGTVAIAERIENDFRVSVGGAPASVVDRLLEWAGRNPLDLTGTWSGEASVSGAWVRPSLHGRLEWSAFGAAGREVGQLDATLSGSEGTWRVDADLRQPRLPGGAAAASLGLEGSVDRGWSLRASGSDWPVDLFVPDQGPFSNLEGEIDFDARFDGPLRRWDGQVDVKATELRVGDARRLSDVEIHGTLRSGSGEVVARSGDLWRFEAVGALGKAWRLAGSWSGLDLAPVLVPSSNFTIRTDGELLVENLGGAGGPEGRLEATRAEISSGRIQLTLTEPLRGRLERSGRATLEAAWNERRGTTVTLEALREADGNVVAHLGGDVPLALAEAYRPGSGSVRGMARVDVDVRRSAEGGWMPRGTVDVRDATLDLGYRIAVTDVNGRLAVTPDGVRDVDVAGGVGGGSFAISGAWNWTGGPDLRWTVDRAGLALVPWLESRVSGSGTLTGGERLLVAGDLNVIQALYDRNVEWAEFLPWFRREIRPRGRGRTAPVELDLDVSSEGGVFVRNNLADAELRGRLHISGTTDAPEWRGRIEIVEGTFVFRRREFELTAGTVRFQEGASRNPRLEFRGETIVEADSGDYVIFLEADGTLRDPRVRFRAEDPTLSEDDVLALVTFGRTLAELQSQGAGFELEELLAVTAGPYASEVEGRIHRVIPVDRIAIEPSFSLSSGVTEPRLSIGKDLLENLRATVRTGLGEARDQKVSLELDLTRRVSVESYWESQTTSEEGTFGADLSYRVPFWRLSDLWRRVPRDAEEVVE